MRLRPLQFESLNQWLQDDHLAAFRAFKASQCDDITRPLPDAKLVLIQALAALRTMAQTLDVDTPTKARIFFETHFQPCQIEREGRASGMITGYFEPEVEASLKQSHAGLTPILSLPEKHVRLDPESQDYPEQLGAGLNAALKHDHVYQVMPTRGEIARGAPLNATAIAYLKDPVDAYFIHIQGSAALRLEDESLLRIAYAGRNGHPYRSIGKYVIDQGYFEEGQVTYAALVDWLHRHTELQEEVFAHNPSYIFFQKAKQQDPDLGPVAAAGVPLTPMRSLAVDRSFHVYHLPIWVEATLPDENAFKTTIPFHQLMIAQDTGAAIIGPERGDVFFGRGEHCGKRAGATQQDARFVLLLPKSIDPSLVLAG